MPAANPEIVVEAPDPLTVPGLIIQFPVGKPFRTTVPVITVQFGCVIVPIVGADGAFTVIVPVALRMPQLPVNGIL